MIYVPDLNNYSCVYMYSSNTLRAYIQAPNYDTTVNYRDYYINSNYLYTDGQQYFGTYSTLPVCLSSSVLTDEVYYRNDITDILICFFILAIVCFWCPYKLFSKLFRRVLK